MRLHGPRFRTMSSHAAGQDDAGDYVLHSTGRCAHARDYLERLARAAGFAIEALQPTILRKDLGADIAGFNVLLRRAAAV